MNQAVAAAAPPVRLGRKLLAESLATHGGLWLLAVGLLVFLTLPLATLLIKSFEDRAGAFVGLANFVQYVQTPALARSTGNTITFALLTTLITVPLAFVFAYAIQRTCIPLKGLWRSIALIPILAPSLLAALSFIYLFGNQGAFKFVLGWFGIPTIYGLPGMVLAMSFAAFPHAVMILLAALALSDARLYEAADAMGTRAWRRFLTITLPGAKYGLISAAMVVFTMGVSEFGVPKVIGGNYPVLAIDIYKQVIGQQNFQMGAVVGLVLLLPAVVAFVVDHQVRRKQKALLTARSVPYAPRPSRLRDGVFLRLRAARVGGDAPRDGHGGVRLVREVLAVQPVVHAGALHVRLRRCRRRARVPQQPGAGRLVRGARRGADVRRRVLGREDARRGRAAAGDPLPGHAADGGARHGARHRLHPVLQQSGQSAARAVRHDGDPRHLHDHPLLFVEPPHRRDRAEAARRRVRVGVGVAQGAVLQDVLACHGARCACRRSSTWAATISSTR